MRVDAAGEHVETGCVDLLAFRVQVPAHADDPVAGDRDVGHPRPPRRDDRPAADDHRDSRRRLRTSIATATSDVCTDSAGLWLTPPLQRTNSMPTSVSADITTASWPAPLGNWAGSTRCSLTACVSNETRRGEQCTAGF